MNHKMRLLFVYNIDGDFFSLIEATFHKLVSPKTYTCSLCRITYPFVSMRTEWKDFVRSLPYQKTFLHRDEFRKKYPNQQHIQLPALFTENSSGIHLLIPAQKINEVHNISELKELVRRFLPNSKDKEVLYRCPECGLKYRDKETAEKCEAWCREHQSCNLDIIKNAVEN